jgi:hypothetical protein
MLTFVFKHPLIIALGFGLILLSFYLAWRKHTLLLSGHLADGEVVELIPHRGSKGGVSYTLRVSYAQRDGDKAEFTTTFACSPPLHQLGEKIRVVYYDGQAQPDILAFPDLFLFPWACFCAGIFLLLMCAGFAYGPSLIDSTYLPQLANVDPLKTLHVIK